MSKFKRGDVCYVEVGTRAVQPWYGLYRTFEVEEEGEIVRVNGKKLPGTWYGEEEKVVGVDSTVGLIYVAASKLRKVKEIGK